MTGALGVAACVKGRAVAAAPAPLDWSAQSLIYAVREPFPSQATQTSLIYGEVSASEHLRIASRMAGYGIIFSDGVEADNVTFNSGADVTVSVAEKCARLVVAG